MPKRDAFVRQLREVRAYFEEGATGVINIPKVPEVLNRRRALELQELSPPTTGS